MLCRLLRNDSDGLHKRQGVIEFSVVDAFRGCVGFAKSGPRQIPGRFRVLGTVPMEGAVLESQRQTKRVRARQQLSCQLGRHGEVVGGDRHEVERRHEKVGAGRRRAIGGRQDIQPWWPHGRAPTLRAEWDWGNRICWRGSLCRPVGGEWISNIREFRCHGRYCIAESCCP